MIAIPENRFTGVTLLVLLFSLSMFFCTDEAVVPNDARSVDTLYISSKDTLIRVDTIMSLDTLVKITRDTLFSIDTVIRVDTIKSLDTLVRITRDTLYNIDTLIIAADSLFVYDSTWVVKTVVSYDTQYLSLDTLTLVNQKAMNLAGITGTVDLSFLEELTMLEWLNLAGVEAESFAPLEKLTNLRYLSLRGSAFKDASLLRLLAKLEFLDLEQCTVNDTLDLTRYPDIRDVNLANATIEKLAPIISLRNLETLNLTGASVDEIDIADCSVIKTIDMSGTSVGSIAPIDGLENCKELFMENISVQSGSIIIHDLAALDTFTLKTGSYCDTLLLQELPELMQLEFDISGYTQVVIRDLEKVEKITMDISFKSSVSLDGLPACSAVSVDWKAEDGEKPGFWSMQDVVITEMDFRGKNVASLPDLSQCTSLKHLDIRGCRVLADVSNLGKLEWIQTLDIGGRSYFKPEDWTPLLECLSSGDTLTEYTDEESYQNADSAIPYDVLIDLKATGVYYQMRER